MSPQPPTTRKLELEDIRHQDEKLRIVVWGEPGAGKTTFAFTAPKPLVVDTDGGLIAVTSVNPDGSPGKRIVPEGYRDLEAFAYWLKAHASEGDYETVVIDSLDSLVFRLMGELMTNDLEWDQGKGKTFRPSSEFAAEQGHYGANQRQIGMLLDALKTMGLHVIVTSGAREADATKDRKRGINVSPGMVNIVTRWASIIGELVLVTKGANEGKRAMLVKNLDPARETKNRFSTLLGDVIIDPTFPKIWEAINKREETK